MDVTHRVTASTLTLNPGKNHSTHHDGASFSTTNNRGKRNHSTLNLFPQQLSTSLAHRLGNLTTNQSHSLTSLQGATKENPFKQWPLKGAAFHLFNLWQIRKLSVPNCSLIISGNQKNGRERYTCNVFLLYMYTDNQLHTTNTNPTGKLTYSPIHTCLHDTDPCLSQEGMGNSSFL